MVASGVVQNFNQLIGNTKVFEVPDFQRNYSWELKQVEELYTDIHKTSVSQESHFMGSLIILEEASSSEVVSVVDGQQRLTTLFLLVAVIRDKAVQLNETLQPVGGMNAPVSVPLVAHNILYIPGPNEKLRFRAHPLIQDLAKKHVWSYPSAERPKMPEKHFSYTLDFRKARKKLTSLVESSLENFSDVQKKLEYLNNLLYTIQYKLQLLNVTSTSRPESYEIFMTLNSRGLALGPSDLVKSEIFKNLTSGLNAHDNEVKSSELTADWKELIDNLENGDVDQFLRHYLVSKYEGSLTSKRIFEKVEKLISGTIDRPLNPKVESEVLLKDLIKCSAIYGKLLSGNAPELGKGALSLKLLAQFTDSYRIFLLAVLDPQIPLSDPQRVDLVRLTEVLALRWILVGKNAQVLEDTFQDLSLNLRQKGRYEESADLLISKIPDDAQVAKEFEFEGDSANLVRVVLYRINQQWDQSEVIPFDPSKIHIEHIAPNKPTDHWIGVLFPNDEGIDREAEYSAAVELWGNKTLLDSKINQSIKQNPFLEKARGLNSGEWPGYQHSTVAITTDLGDKLNAWNRQEISIRSKWIADCFCKIWAASPANSAVVSFSKFRENYLNS